MTSAFSKKHIEDRLTALLKTLPEVSSAWLGGSRATGTEDELSDTDVVIVSSEPEKIFTALEGLLHKEFSVAHVWTVEDNPRKNFLQKFYILKNSPEVYYIDTGVFTSLNPEDYREFFNESRHGLPEILCDDSHILAKARQAPLMEAPFSVINDNTRARAEVMYRTFLKESLRGKYIDSFAFFQRLLAIWVQCLRRRYAPQKHDFGLRYIYRDLPQSEATRIEKYLKVHDLETMKQYAQEIRNQIFSL